MFKSLAILASLAFLAAPASAQCTGCSVSYLGQACGPNLSVTLERRNPSVAEIGVHFTDGNTAGIGFLMLGTQQVDLPIPGTLCRLYTDFVYGHFIQIDNAGAFDWVHPWPNGNPGFVFVQVIDFLRQGLLDIRTTRAARAERNS